MSNKQTQHDQWWAGGVLEQMVRTWMTPYMDISACRDRRMVKVAAQAEGWSRMNHWLFFRAMAAQPEIQSALILGVYRGRDLGYIADNCAELRVSSPISIVAVDRFKNVLCDHWGTDGIGKTWEEIGNGPPPDKQLAQKICAQFPSPFVTIEITENDDAEYLQKESRTFDCIYLDTAHDFATVDRQLTQIRRLCRNRETIICGDDYTDNALFQVRSAVGKHFAHILNLDKIWVSNRANMKEIESFSANP